MPSGSIYAAGEFVRNQMGRSPEEIGSKQPEQRLPKVLVVDDEKRIADTLTEILEMVGFQVVSACDGRGALEAAAKFQPDYLLSDVLMPRMNGVELAIAANGCAIPAPLILGLGA
jgi:CheY-like chemotaxis protein